MENSGDYITVKDVAAKLSVTTKTVYEWIKKGDLPALKLARTIRIHRDEIEYQGSRYEPPARRAKRT